MKVSWDSRDIFFLEGEGRSRLNISVGGLTMLTTARIPVRFRNSLIAVVNGELQSMLTTQNATLVPKYLQRELARKTFDVERRDVRHEKQKLKPSWQCTNINGGRKLKFSVVSFPENGSIKNIPLKPGERLAGVGKVALRIIVETRQCSDILDGLGSDSPDQQRGD